MTDIEHIQQTKRRKRSIDLFYLLSVVVCCLFGQTFNHTTFDREAVMVLMVVVLEEVRFKKC